MFNGVFMRSLSGDDLNRSPSEQAANARGMIRP